MQELRGGVVCRLLLLQLQLTAAHTAAGCSRGKQLQKRCTLNPLQLVVGISILSQKGQNSGLGRKGLKPMKNI